MEKVQWNSIDNKQNRLEQPKNDTSSTPPTEIINTLIYKLFCINILFMWQIERKWEIDVYEHEYIV